MLTFTQIAQSTKVTDTIPTYEGTATSYQKLHHLLDEAAYAQAFSEWDLLRRELATWSSLVYLRFSQDTQNPEYLAARTYCDELSPKLTDLEVQFTKRLVQAPIREVMVEHVGLHAVRLWENALTTFDPAIQADLVEESRLSAKYTELLASAQISFQGETLNLSGLRRFAEDPDRNVRYQAARHRWAFFEEHSTELDEIFGELVQVRHRMAQTLGYETYIELGYRRMQRTDYTQVDVAQYRDQVRTLVVPLAQQLIAQQAQVLGVDKVMAWDETVFDPKGNPAPQGTYGELLVKAQTMFDEMAPALSDFFRMMNTGDYLDLQNRQAKAGGGFCTSFPSYGMPYIFANFNGTKGDVEVFTHEMGHAFQCYQSRQLPVFDYLWPTMESCEIHSMGLEFLTWPQMEQFFGSEAERFRRIHLAESLLFLPYGVAVDHFQHLVYANPTATPTERKQMWQAMEAQYLPWRDYGDLGHPGLGGLWQGQAHIYNSPFYYIDYTLALCCALQFWVRSEVDYPAALADYIELCQKGGSAPFQELVHSAHLVSPFAPGALADVVAQAQAVLIPQKS